MSVTVSVVKSVIYIFSQNYPICYNQTYFLNQYFSEGRSHVQCHLSQLRKYNCDIPNRVKTSYLGDSTVCLSQLIISVDILN